jgi:hypothetical protein
MELKELETETRGECFLFITSEKQLDVLAEKVASRIIESQPVPKPAPQTEQPLTQAEAEQFLGKSRQTLYSWRKRQLIKAYTLGGRVYYKPSELLSALEKSGV